LHPAVPKKVQKETFEAERWRILSEAVEAIHTKTPVSVTLEAL
jgi:hypothetical protein